MHEHVELTIQYYRRHPRVRTYAQVRKREQQLQNHSTYL